MPISPELKFRLWFFIFVGKRNSCVQNAFVLDASALRDTTARGSTSSSAYWDIGVLWLSVWSPKIYLSLNL